MQLVKERTSVPVPAVFGYITSAKNEIGAPFMLMECLSGNVGVDLNGVEIPTQYKASLHREMARLQVDHTGTPLWTYGTDGESDRDLINNIFKDWRYRQASRRDL